MQISTVAVGLTVNAMVTIEEQLTPLLDKPDQAPML
jgi:hypothetical protein